MNTSATRLTNRARRPDAVEIRGRRVISVRMGDSAIVHSRGRWLRKVRNSPSQQRPGELSQASEQGAASRTQRRRECRLAPAQALQPAHTKTLGLKLQVIGNSDRAVEPAAETRDRLQP